jgi:hypothetical protein
LRTIVFSFPFQISWGKPNQGEPGKAEYHRSAVYLSAAAALEIAEWEIVQAFPESDWLLRKAKFTARSACKAREFSGMYWKDARRRIGTKKVRKMLDTVLMNLPSAYLVLSPESGLAAFHSEQFFTLARHGLEKLAQRYGKVLQYARPAPAQGA